MDWEDVAQIYNGVLLGHKKEWNNAFAATWMDLETIMQKEGNQTHEDKYHTTYMWNLKKKGGTNKLKYKVEIELQMQERNLWLPGDKRRRDKLGDWAWAWNTTIYKTDNQ